MVRFMRVAKTTGSKALKAFAWAKEMARFVEKYDGVKNVGVYIDSVGEVGNVRWFVDYADLATFERVQAQVLADPAYWEKIQQADGLFIEGQVEDVLMRAI